MSLGIGLDINRIGPGLAALMSNYPGAAMAADFTKGLYYADGAKSLGELITDRRNTEIILPGANGFLQTIPAGQPARTSKGLGTFGAATALLRNAHKINQDSVWSPFYNGTTFAANAYIPGGISRHYLGGGSPGFEQRFQPLLNSASGMVNVSAIIEQISGVTFELGLRNDTAATWVGTGVYTWAANSFVQSNGMISGIKTEILTENGPNGGRVVRMSFDCDATGLGAAVQSIRIYPNGIPANTANTVVHYANVTEGAGYKGIVRTDTSVPLTRAACQPIVTQGLGAELVTNGSFDEGAIGWASFGGGSPLATVTDGQYTLTAMASGSMIVQQNNVLEIGKTYEITVDVVSLPASAVHVSQTGPSASLGVLSEGINKFIFVAIRNSISVGNVAINFPIGASFTLNEVSVREVTPFDGYTPGPQTGQITASIPVSATKRILKRWVMNATDYVELYYSSAGAITLESVTGGTSRGLVSVGGKDDGLEHTIAYLFSPLGDLKLAVDSDVPTTTAGVTMPTSFNTIQLGHGEAIDQMNDFINTFGAVSGDKFDEWR